MATGDAFACTFSTTGTPILNVSGSPVRWNPFATDANGPARTTTVRDLIDAARVRHWSFIDVQLADGAAVLWLNQRQRHLLLKFRDALRGLLGVSVETAAAVGGGLIAFSPNGTPIITQAGDGYGVALNSTGTPVIDRDRPMIPRDPRGATSGRSVGWPLPIDVVAVLTLTATMQDGSEVPVTIVDESERLRVGPGRYLPAYIASNRLVPIRSAPASASNDAWSVVASVRLSCIETVSLSSPTDILTVPAPLIEPLTAGLAELFANQSRSCTVAERQQFAAAARRAELEIAESAFDVLGDIQDTNVIYEG